MGDDMQRGFHHGMRKAFADKSPNYSPSASYNYNPAGMHGQGGGQQHPRRRTDRFKRETVGGMERILKQNEMMIRLLREIRDLLAAAGGRQPASGETSPGQDQTSQPQQDQESQGQEYFDDQENGF